MLLQQRDRRAKWLLSWALVPPALVVLFVGFAEGGSRFALVALPAFLLLAGEGLDFLIRYTSENRRKAAWLLAGVVVLSLGLKDGLYFTVERGQRPRWREAAEYVRSKAQADGAPLIATAAPAGPEVLAFYLARPGLEGPLAVAPKPMGLAELERQPKDRVCYVVVEETSNARPAPELLKFLERNGSRVKTFSAQSPVPGLLVAHLSPAGARALRAVKPQSRRRRCSTSVFIASNPCLNRIFFPSARLRPRYSTGTSWIGTPRFRTSAVTSGQKSKPFARSGSDLISGARKTL